MKSTTTRELTHKLTCDPNTQRWSCKCGYLLGRDGHEALYAVCPEYGYIEFDISKTTHEAATPTATPKRQAGRRVARIHRQGSDLFDS